MARELIGRVRQALGDRYNVITAVGRGGNATLYGAFDKDGRRVAIKVLHPELAVSVAADRFLREIRYASTLDHPHIAPLLDSGETDYLLWFVMPFVAGETLRQLLRRERGPRRAGTRPREGSRASRYQAGQHRAVGRGRRRDPGRFWDRAGDRPLRRGPCDPQRLRRWHGGVHEPRAGRRLARYRRPDRYLFSWRRAVRSASGPAPVCRRERGRGARHAAARAPTRPAQVAA